MMKMKRWEIYLELVFEFVFGIFALVLLIYGIPKLLGFFWPFVVSWIVAMLAGPLCSFLEKKLKVSRKWGSAMILILSICAVAGVIVLLVSVIGNQALEWAADLPNIYHKMMEQLGSFGERISRWHIASLPFLQEGIHKVVVSANSAISSVVSNIGAYGMEHAGSFAKGVTNGLIGTIVMLISAYLLICEREEIIKNYRKIMPEFIKEKVDIFCQNTLGVLGSYCLVQMKLMVVIAIILWIGFLVLGINYGVLFAVLISLLDVLPFLGTGTALIPWAIYMMITGQVKAGIGFLILYVICLVLKQVLQPKMIGDQMEMNSLMTLILMYAGLKLKGIGGLILALVFGIFFTNLYKRGAFDSMINRTKYRLTMLHDLEKENK
ncbi:MAG: sporulation integral membrane protein YtvI [Candidatus Fimousia sp.]|uniref:sporulation integral membrane protein YtvI n=1 Tax=Anaerostipes sp. 992a TaxID=1261637 RepID=UPI0009FB830D|nr:sporulation integral membrane protein YtvI [Anaerostipes sp. 992a]MDD5968122.1 sporulation integral membrane protein YtvI [Anaerostipes sp.]